MTNLKRVIQKYVDIKNGLGSVPRILYCGHDSDVFDFLSPQSEATKYYSLIEEGLTVSAENYDAVIIYEDNFPLVHSSNEDLAGKIETIVYQHSNLEEMPINLRRDYIGRQYSQHEFDDVYVFSQGEVESEFQKWTTKQEETIDPEETVETIEQEEVTATPSRSIFNWGSDHRSN